MPEFYGLRRSMDTLTVMAEKAAAEGARLSMTCECCPFGRCARPVQTGRARLRPIALADNSAMPDEARRLRALLRMGLIPGYSSLQENCVYNTALPIGPDGREIGRCRKTRLCAQGAVYLPGRASRRAAATRAPA